MNIIDVKQVGKASIILAFTLEFPALSLSVRDCKLMEGKNGKWISFPSREYVDVEGKRKYFSYVQIAEARKSAFTEKCLELLKPHVPIPPTAANYVPPVQEEAPF